MLSRIILLQFLLVLLISCANQNNSSSIENKDNIKKPKEMYQEAKSFFDKDEYEISNDLFEELKKIYPLSNEAIQAEVMIGFISYLKLDYESAISQFDKIIIKYPAHKNLDYIYYMRAMCNYEQITHHGLDGTYNELAITDFKQVIKRFPDSEYAKDSRQKIILVKTNKAAKHMEIGRFYLKQKKYSAALNRFKIILDDYSMTKFAPEALHRMVESYYYMGMIDDSRKTASILGYNYPKSEWYEYSYNLINKINDEGKLFKKIRNLF